MRNIFLFLRRYFTFIAFALLQLLCLWMLFNYNRFHRAVFFGAATEFTGRVNTQVDKLDDYFHQGEENRRLHRINDSLMNMLKSNLLPMDTAQRFVTDTVRKDSTLSALRYVWRDAKVVYNTVNAEQNYMQLNRGSKYGVKDNMAVLSSDGAVVGVVVNVSSNFSQVMSLLHVQSSVSASHKNTGTLGKIEWDAKDPRFVVLKGISRSVQLKIGDSVVSSRYSYNFPPDYLVGTIAEVNSDPATGFYLLKVRTAAAFPSLQQVFVVENLQREEQLQLSKDTDAKMEQQRRGQR